MKRVVRSKSAREIYNSNSSENENGFDAFLSTFSFKKTELAHLSDAANSTVTETNALGKEDQTSKGISRRGSLSHRHRSMYRATLEGDWLAAEMLLEGDPSLACDEISEEGDRSLHVAAALKHKEFVLKLVERLSSSELASLDGHGYTACCYAVMAGAVEVADLMIKKNPNLATARDGENKTPLHKAALRRNAKMVSYLLKSTKLEDLSKDGWFDLLLETINGKMYDVALKISRSNEELATMANKDETALHLLAGQWQNPRNNGVMRRDMRLLAKQLWEGFQRLGEASLLELMKNPPILLDAAAAGNIELMTMVTHTYPELICHTYSQGYTIFHAAVIFRQEKLFGLIEEIGGRKDLIAMSQDQDGNNILHLAAKLANPDITNTLPWVAFHMQNEVLWFKNVEAIVPPSCLKMKNKDGHTPYQLFVKEHKSLLENSTTWMKTIANSCVVIATLILAMVFASPFTVPGGYNQVTGIPILLKSKWFTCFVLFEALTLFSSAWSILSFLEMMMLTPDEGSFRSVMPKFFTRGLTALTCSVCGIVSAFLSAYFLVFVEERATLIMFVIISVYIAFVPTVCLKNIDFYFQLPIHSSTKIRLTRPVRHTLFRRPAHTTAAAHNYTSTYVLDFLNLFMDYVHG